jgi:hypothetical protein
VNDTAEKKSVLLALQKGELYLSGQFVSGSNYTFLAKIRHGGQEYPVVYKPSRGEQPLWDFPVGTLAKREVAAFLVSEALKWNLVPPTVYRRSGPHGPGSVQLYIDHDINYHYFTFNPENRQRLRPAAVFDLIINNADRKGGHIFFDGTDHLWLIDHGVCFHIEDKLRTVIWDFAGESIPDDLIASLKMLLNELEDKEIPLTRLLQKLLDKNEIIALIRRIRQLLSSCQFPAATGNRRPYPWPPV